MQRDNKYILKNAINIFVDNNVYKPAFKMRSKILQEQVYLNFSAIFWICKLLNLCFRYQRYLIGQKLLLYMKIKPKDQMMSRIKDIKIVTNLHSCIFFIYLISIIKRSSIIETTFFESINIFKRFLQPILATNLGIIIRKIFGHLKLFFTNLAYAKSWKNIDNFVIGEQEMAPKQKWRKIFYLDNVHNNENLETMMQNN